MELLTDRLLLRAFTADDLPAFVAYRARPEVAAYQSWDETYAMPDAERFFAEQQGLTCGQAGAWFQLGVSRS